MDNNLILASSALPSTRKELDEVLKVISLKAVKIKSIKTPAKYRKVREGKKGQKWNYVTDDFCMQMLDHYYPGWSWEFHRDSFGNYAGYVHGCGTLTVLESPGLIRKITGNGEVEIKMGKENGEPVTSSFYKIVETDALKRACMRLGFAFDIYQEVDAGLGIPDEKLIEEMPMEAVITYWDDWMPKLIKACRKKEFDWVNLSKLTMSYFTGQVTKEKLLSKLGGILE